MNIIFGKIQISLRQYNNEELGITKSRALCAQKFKGIFGFGPKKTQWLLSSSGASQNLKVDNFYLRESSFNREKKLEKALSHSCLKFIGPDLKQVFFRRKLRSKQFGRFLRVPRVSATRGARKIRKRKLQPKPIIGSNPILTTLNIFRGVIQIIQKFV
jgi:hypothetical protein